MGSGHSSTQMHNPDALYLLKEKQKIEKFVQAGQFAQARKVADRLCRKQKHNPEAWFLAGAVCGQQGDYDQAVVCCRRTVQLAPQVAIGHFNLGVALRNCGHRKQAVEPLKKSIELQPNLSEAYRELGLIYSALDDDTAALWAFTELLRLQPQDLGGWIAQGNLYERQARLQQAEDSYRQALKLAPNAVAAGVNLGNVLKALGKIDEAEACYQQLLAANPDNVDVLFNLGVLYQAEYRCLEAEGLYRKILEKHPEHIAAQNNLGVVLIIQSRLPQAEDIFQDIVNRQPENLEAKRNLASIYREQGRLQAAAEQLDQVLQAEPEHVAARQDRALLLLQQGSFEQGWQEYEWRNPQALHSSERWPFPVWDGTDARQQTILVFPEQGIGDEIMFASCIPDLQARVGNIVLACDPRLVPLMQRSFPDIQVIGRGPSQGSDWLAGLPPVDAQISIASLPRYFRRQVDDFPEKNQYLIAAGDASEKWRERYEALGSSGLKIGLSWRGGHISNTRMKRSIELPAWQKILQTSGAHFVNLQYGDCTRELQHMVNQYGIEIHDWDDSDPLKDMDDFAAKIHALDLVISIDNSTVHLAGSLGIPTWLLQPFAADWRWLVATSRSYWYPSIRQYRQQAIGQWEPLINQVAVDLQQYINNEQK